jgi:hypothetical protein
MNIATCIYSFLTKGNSFFKTVFWNGSAFKDVAGTAALKKPCRDRSPCKKKSRWNGSPSKILSSRAK